MAGTDTLALLGDVDALPWVDGVIYVGDEPGHGAGVLLPTTLAPSVSTALLARCLGGRGAPPWIVLPSERRVLSCADAHPIERKKLEEWLASREATRPGDA